MKKVLYLLTKDPSQDVQNFFNPKALSNLETSAILLHDVVLSRQIPVRHVYALAEDAAARNIGPSVPTVSYQEMLRMIFDADSVVAL